jgi:tetratricopeptide (TPR) repeat protein
MEHYREAIGQDRRLVMIAGEAFARCSLGSWHSLLGQMLQGEGRPDEAEEHFRQGQELVEKLVRNGKDKDAQVEPRPLLAHCLYLRAALREEAKPAEARGLFAEALKVLSELSSESPGDVGRRSSVADAHYRLGVVAWAMARSREAGEHFRAAREAMTKLAAELPGGEAGPGDPGHNENELAWFLATCPDESFRDPRRAVELARKATTRAPLRGDFWDTLGAAYFRAGDFRAAVGALEKSVEIQKGAEPSDWFYLALAHQRLGDPAKARACYDKAVAWVEGHKSSGQTLRLLRAEAAAALGVPRNAGSAKPAPRE